MDVNELASTVAVRLSGCRRILNDQHHLIATRSVDQIWGDQDPRGDEDHIAALCRHYNVPLVSMRAAVFDAVRGGAVPLRHFMQDCKHPNDVGHKLARVVVDGCLAPVPPHNTHVRRRPRRCQDRCGQ